MKFIDGNTFDLKTAKMFRKKVQVRAFLNRRGAIYHQPWGDQTFPGAHYIIVAPDGEIYGCATEEFEATYTPVPDCDDVYHKPKAIHALQMEAPFKVTAQTADGNIEVADAEGAAGDWLVEQPCGDRQLIPNRSFKRLYEETGSET